MSNFLRQSTASQSRILGPFIDDTDFKTASTGLTIANTDIKLFVNGAASANKNSGGGTHRTNGNYGVTFDATDTATVGELEVSVKVAGALQVFKTFYVVEEAVFDALFVASAPGYVVDQPVNATKVGGTTQTGRDIGASVLLSSGTGTGQVKLASGYIAPNWGDVGNPTTSLNLSGTTIATTQKVDVETIKTQAVTAAAGVTFPTSIASPTNITAGTITTVTNLTNAATAGDLTAAMKASVNAEADTALSDYDGPTNAELATALGTADDAVLAQVALVKTETDKIAAVLADTNELQTDWANGGRLDLILDARASQTSVDDLPTNAELATALGTADDAVLAQVALVKAVTDKLDDTLEDQGGGVYGFTADALQEAPTGGGGDPWATSLPGAYGAGTAGKIVGDNINATISSRATQTSVDDLPTNAELATALGTADDAVLTAIDALPTNAELATALGTADDAVLAAVAALTIPTTAQIADKILDRSLAGGSDDTGPEARSVRNALRSLRNKSAIAAGTLTVREEDDTTAAWTAAVTTAPGDPLTSIDPT